jgi:hypothetical protein
MNLILFTGDPSYLSYWLLLLLCKIKHKKLYLGVMELKGGTSSKGYFLNMYFSGMLLEGFYCIVIILAK